jgi:hypothetical protein
MDNVFNPKTRERIDELCRKISVSHTLDDEIQAELRGHIEDKMLAYLRNEERLSEEDAFILVERHFGDPANIKIQLQTVHTVDAHVGLARRLLAIVTLHVGLLAALEIAAFTWWNLSVWWQLRSHDAVIQSSDQLLIGVVGLMLYVLILWRVLARWKRRELAGERIWFMRWPIPAMAGLLALFFGLHSVTPDPLGPLDGYQLKSITFFPVVATMIVIVIVAPILSAFIWLWWCDRPPRRPRTLIYTALVWLALAVIPWNNAKFVRVAAHSIESGPVDSQGVELLALFRMPLENETVLSSLRMGFTMRDPSLTELLMSIVLSGTMASAAIILYKWIISSSLLLVRRSPNRHS